MKKSKIYLITSIIFLILLITTTFIENMEDPGPKSLGMFLSCLTGFYFGSYLVVKDYEK
jgi:hypothetical protein